MNPIKTTDCTHVLEAPLNWDEERDGECVPLPVVKRGKMLMSVWVPTPDELEALNKGGGVRLTVFALNHPPVALDVVEPTVIE